jgi:hypothetical protein
MEVSNKKYSQMAKDYKKADKIYSEVKTKSYGMGSQKMSKGDHGCAQPSERADYDYMKGIKTSPVYVSGGLKPRKGTL